MAAHETSVSLHRRAVRTTSIALAPDWLIGALLSVITIALLVVTAPQIGLTWDEPVYMAAQSAYYDWFEQLAAAPHMALSEAGIRAAWEINHEHPPLAKIWSGALWRLIHGTLDPLVAHRLGTIILVGLMVALIFCTVTQSYGRSAGLAAVAALLTLPRFFFHAHLAALDVPATLAYVGILTLFWHTRAVRGLRRSCVIGLLLALVWGAGLATKINAAFALPVLVIWVLLADRRREHVVRLAIMAAVGPLVFVALWPWLYHDTVHRLGRYLLFITVDHWQISQWYLGNLYMPPPWHFPFVMLVMVVPLTTFSLMLVGIARARYDPRPDHPILLWISAAAMPLLALAGGKSMVYDNERLFMASFPYVAMLAGCGLAWLLTGVARVAQRRRPGATVPGVLLLVIAAQLPQLLSAATLYPHLLSYYSETVGGLPGARRLGMETTYWCETYAAALEYVNIHARPGAVVWVEDWSHDVLIWYQASGRLRPDLRVALAPGAVSQIPHSDRYAVEADMWQADYVIRQYRQVSFDDQWQRFRAEHAPRLMLARQGVVLMELFERR
jgi:4-amino-4-deoxy-L-arabinose transferase-like glycosyltransferase